MSFNFANIQDHQQGWEPQYSGNMDMNFDIQQQPQHQQSTGFTPGNPHQPLEDCLLKTEDCNSIENQLFSAENLNNLQFRYNPDLNEQVPINFPSFTAHSISNSSDHSQSPVNIGNNDAMAPNMQQLGETPKQYPSPQQSQNNHSSNDETLTEEELLKRRKAQNRAAQRAFRERKEMKLKDLEDKLNQSERNRTELMNQLDDLRKRNIVIQAENKILLQNTNGNVPMEIDNKEHGGEFSFPTKDAFYSNHANFLTASKLSTFQHNVNHYTHDGQKTVSLGMNGVWEFVNEYNQKNDEDIDANLVLFKLKGKEVCKSNGPAYDVGFVIETLKEVIQEQHQQ